MPAGNVFTWVLVGFPLYLLMKGRLATYIALATKAAATTAAATATTGSGAAATATTVVPTTSGLIPATGGAGAGAAG